MIITNEFLQSTFQIRVNGSTGTCFTTDVNGKHLLITAKHIFKTNHSNGDKVEIEVYKESIWQRVVCRIFNHNNKEVDISVLLPEVRFSDFSFKTLLSTASIALSQQTLFLGYQTDVKWRICMS